ncbi:LysR family transcriptional regulator [Lacibacterium aquatile]|uniref:LysR family transcriptional regulator n=1 Tax=Lacibacterium aquatile TaxID=1168082 RepID=A0ABW5DNP2_9PROT
MDRFDDLVVFIEVVDSGSLTAAGEHLGLSASAVSRRISQFEERLGTSLFSRTTRRIALTEVGAAFCHRARTILAALDEAERSVGEMGDEPRGTLRLMAPVHFGQRHVSAVLPAFLARFPKVALDVQFHARPAMTSENAFDVAIRADRLTESTLIARRLAPLRICVLGSPEYLTRRGIPRVPSDLDRHECLYRTLGGTRVPWELSIGGATANVGTTGSFQSDDLDVLRDMACSGFGLAQLPAFIADEELRSGALVPLLDEFASRDHSLHIVYPPARHLAPKVRAFVDHLVETMGKPTYWDSAMLAYT